jgi:hypothetical protein
MELLMMMRCPMYKCYAENARELLKPRKMVEVGRGGEQNECSTRNGSKSQSRSTLGPKLAAHIYLVALPL